MVWQLQDAKQKFSELVRLALEEGPQIVTRHGEEVVVVLSTEEYRKLTADTPTFKNFLLSAPDFELLDIKRATDQPRVVEL